jgi:hypothetical protein
VEEWKLSSRKSIFILNSLKLSQTPKMNPLYISLGLTIAFVQTQAENIHHHPHAGTAHVAHSNSQQTHITHHQVDHHGHGVAVPIHHGQWAPPPITRGKASVVHKAHGNEL